MPEHSVLNKACPQGKPVNQSLTDLGKGNTQVQSTLATLFHLGVAGGGGRGSEKKTEKYFSSSQSRGIGFVEL